MNLVNIQTHTEYFCKLFIRNVKKHDPIARLSISILYSEALTFKLTQKIYMLSRDILLQTRNKFLLKADFIERYFSCNALIFLVTIFQSLELSCITDYQNDLEKLLTILLRFPVSRKHLSRHEVQRC